MATAATIKKNIAKLEAALKSKATPKTLKPKLEAQLVKSKAELSGINKGTKPKTSSTKSTQTALQKLKEMVNKNKKFKTYKGAGVDLEKDADRPALRTGKRIAKESGKTYYEYRANRIDVKQPPKRYPKLEKGGDLKNWKAPKEIYSGKDIKVTVPKMGDFEEYKVIFVYDKENFIFKMYDPTKKRVLVRMSGLDFENNLMNGSYIIDGYMPKTLPSIYRFNEYAKGGETLMMGDEEVYIKKSSIGLEDEVCLFYKKDDSILKCISKNQFDKFIEQGKLIPKKEQGGYMADGGYVAVSETKDGYWVVISRPTTKESAEEMADSLREDNRKVLNEETKVVTLEEAKAHKKIIGKEYLEKGGYMAKGGAIKDWEDKMKGRKDIEFLRIERKEKLPNGNLMIYYKYNTLNEFDTTKVGTDVIKMADGGYMAKGGALEHGLMVGDTVRDIAENSVAIYNHNDKKSYVVDLDKGTRTEWFASFEKEMKYAKHGAYMAMGGEMHRTQDKAYASGGSVDPEKYPELQKIADKISDETAEKINQEVRDVKSNMPYKAQWVLEEVVKDLTNRI